MNPKAEQIRIRYLYRRLVINGDVKVSKDTAKKIVGPDCAYQLYGRQETRHAKPGETIQREDTG